MRIAFLLVLCSILLTAFAGTAAPAENPLTDAQARSLLASLDLPLPGLAPVAAALSCRSRRRSDRGGPR